LAIEAHSHFRNTSERVAIVQHTGIGFGDKDLSILAREIFNYAVRIGELDGYGQEFLTMSYEPRTDLAAAE
jgi:hypothetical protein